MRVSFDLARGLGGIERTPERESEQDESLWKNYPGPDPVSVCDLDSDPEHDSDPDSNSNIPCVHFSAIKNIYQPVF